MSCGCGGGGPRVWWPLVYGLLVVLAGAVVVVRDVFTGFSFGVLPPFILAAGVLAVVNAWNRR